MRSRARLRRWTAVWLAAFVLAAIASGCLRRRYDLCAESPPHDECPRDAGTDAATDAPAVPDASADDAANDAP